MLRILVVDDDTAVRGAIKMVLEQDGQVGGYAGLTVRGDHGHLDRLAVEPDLRRVVSTSKLDAPCLRRTETFRWGGALRYVYSIRAGADRG